MRRKNYIKKNLISYDSFFYNIFNRKNLVKFNLLNFIFFKNLKFYKKKNLITNYFYFNYFNYFLKNKNEFFFKKYFLKKNTKTIFLKNNFKKQFFKLLELNIQNKNSLNSFFLKKHNLYYYFNNCYLSNIITEDLDPNILINKNSHMNFNFLESYLYFINFNLYLFKLNELYKIYIFLILNKLIIKFI